MTPRTSDAVLDRIESSQFDLDADFRLDVQVVEGLTPVPALLRSTSDGCGSTCAGPCASFTDDPYEPAC